MEETIYQEVPSSGFATRSLPRDQRFATWRDSIGVLFDVALDDRADPLAFSASLKGYHLGSLLIGRCASTAQAFRRPPVKIASDGMDHFLIQVFRRGQCDTLHGQGDVSVRAGDVYVIDLAQPYTCVNSAYEHLNLVVPRTLVEGNLVHPDHQHRRVVPREQPLARLFRDLLASVYDSVPEMSMEDSLLTVAPMLRLTESLLNSRAGGMAAEHDGTAVDYALLTSLRRFIETHLKDPALGPDLLLGAFPISRSKLYRLFESRGGVVGYIRLRRLRRSVRDLLDPCQQHRRIYEIAYDWGFQHEGDYTRAFKRLFGLTPREARAAAATVADLTTSAAGISADRGYERWLRDLVAF